MTFEEFLQSLNDKTPPTVADYLKALWYDKKDNWHMAHTIAQEIYDEQGSWIHAYLHREEGDKWNANYWYTRAGRKMPEISLDEEWEDMVRYFLSRS